MQLLGHLLQVARRVADSEKLEEGYRIGTSVLIEVICYTLYCSIISM